MSKQFSVLATDIDLEVIESRLRGFDDVGLLSNKPTEDDMSLLPLDRLAICPREAGRVPLFCYLVPRHGPKKVLIKRVSEVKTVVDEQRSNLVEFWRPFYDGHLMRPGRVYFQNRLVEGGLVVSKDEKFCKWADSVMKRMRTMFAHDRTRRLYVGPDAARRLEAGQIRLE